MNTFELVIVRTGEPIGVNNWGVNGGNCELLDESLVDALDTDLLLGTDGACGVYNRELLPVDGLDTIIVSICSLTDLKLCDNWYSLIIMKNLILF